MVTSGFIVFGSAAAVVGLAGGACNTTGCAGRGVGTPASSSSESLLAVPRMPLKAPRTGGGLEVAGLGSAGFGLAAGATAVAAAFATALPLAFGFAIVFARPFAPALPFSATLAADGFGFDFGFGVAAGTDAGFGAGSSGMPALSFGNGRDFGASDVPVRSDTLLPNSLAWF